MRFLIVSDAWEPQINGVVRYYQQLSAHLRAMGHEVKIIGPADFCSVPMPGYAEIRLSLLPKWRLWRMIDEYNPDSLHIAVEGPLGWAARGWAIKHKQPFSSFFHTRFPDYVAARAKIFGRGIAKALWRASTAFARTFHAPAKTTYVTTQSLADDLQNWGFKQKLTNLSCGCDISQFSPGASDVYKDLPRPIHLYVGRLAPEKNVEAFLNLSLEGSKILVGDGPQRAALEAKHPDALFLGPQTGKALVACYRGADVFVFPSKTDTFGMVIIEALACGVPAAAYDVPGPRDILTHATLGATNIALDKAIEAALGAPGDAPMRAAHIQSLYTWPAIAQSFVETELMRD